MTIEHADSAIGAGAPRRRYQVLLVGRRAIVALCVLVGVVMLVGAVGGLGDSAVFNGVLAVSFVALVVVAPATVLLWCAVGNPPGGRGSTEPLVVRGWQVTRVLVAVAIASFVVLVATDVPLPPGFFSVSAVLAALALVLTFWMSRAAGASPPTGGRRGGALGAFGSVVDGTGGGDGGGGGG